jgi:hypothetical protein
VKQAIKKKTRTREHILADLSINYAERFVLLCGFSAERVSHDYGYDLIVVTYNDSGEVENGQIYVQIKATDRLKLSRDGKTISVRVSRRDLAHWLREPYPVILIVYDGRNDLAFWLYVQAYFESRPSREMFSSEEVAIRIPASQRLNRRAVKKLARYKDRILEQVGGWIHHHG